MIIYAVAAFGIVTVTTILLLFVFNIRKYLGLPPLIAAGVGSLLVCYALPYVFGLIFSTISNGSAAGFKELAPTLASLLAAYILLAAIMAFAVSAAAGSRRQMAPETATDGVESADSGNYLASIFENLMSEKPAQETNSVQEDLIKPDSEDHAEGSDNNVDFANIMDNQEYTMDNQEYEAKKIDARSDLEKIFDETYEDAIPEGISGNSPDNPDNMDLSPAIFEKSVDSTENIDKMRLEQKTVEFDNQSGLSLEECIEEAFRLKAIGDTEGAVLYYMYALDRKCDRELVFLIVLDICVLYKSLGQIELARDVLSNYMDVYGDIMSAATRDEIERNL